MSRDTRSRPTNRMSQKKLDALIERKPRTDMTSKPTLSSNAEYDTLHPEETIREFCAKIRDMMARYDGDRLQLSKLDLEAQDLLHYMEMSKNKNAFDGFNLYKRLCEIRRERRICKNEIELLTPLYNQFNESHLLDQLTKIQGNCRAAKANIEGRVYAVKTDILDEFMKE